MENRTKGIKITFRLTDEDANKFKARCALEGETMQVILERIVKNFMEEAEKKPE